MNKALAIIVIIIVIGASAFGAYTFLKKSKPGQEKAPPGVDVLGRSFQAQKVTMPLGPGSQITLMSQIYTAVGENTTNTTSPPPVNSTLKIVSYSKWPLVNVSMKFMGNVSNQTVPFSLMEIPREWLGQDNITLPLSIPFVREGLCLRLTLANSTETTYTYTASQQVLAYIISVTMEVDNNGVLLKSIYNIRSIKQGTPQSVNLTHILIRTNLTLSNQDVQVEIPSNWSCNPPLSSHLWFMWEGIYKVEGCKLVSAKVSDLRDAIDHEAIVFFLNKGCPHCIRDWNDIVKGLNMTCKESKIDVFIVLLGGFANKTLGDYISLLMNQNGITGTPGFAYFKGGFVQDKMLGERSADDIANFIMKHNPS